MHNRVFIGILLAALMAMALSACSNGQLARSSPAGLDPSPSPSGSNTTPAVPSPAPGQGDPVKATPEASSPAPGQGDPVKATPDASSLPPGQDNPTDTAPAADPSEKGKTENDAGEKPLSGRIICLDPGHQSKIKKQDVPIAPGSDILMPDFAIGTKGVSTGVFEYTVVLEVSKKLKASLETLGAEVVLTRDSPDAMISNVERAQMANDAHADIFVRIHCDGSESQDARGISVLYPGSKYIEDKPMLEKSLALSKSLLESAVAATGAKNRGLVERNDLIGFNYCQVPCTLIEMGFMTNPEEDKLLNGDSYQDKLVKGMSEGIVRYFESE